MASHEIVTRKPSNYDRYWEAAFNRPEHYPIEAVPPASHYRPVGDWLGRLIMPLPGERELTLGCWIEVSHAPQAERERVGQRLRLRWTPTLAHQARLWGATRSVHLDENARNALADGTVLAERLDGREHVNPLESLAAAHPHDDICVRLQGSVRLEAKPPDNGPPILWVTRMPAEITGRFYALVTFLGPVGADGAFRARHYDQAAGAFSGPEELLLLPEVLPDGNGIRNSTAAGIEQSPLNAAGWYAHGDLDASGRFVVRSLAPRALLRLEPQLYHDGVKECMAYLRPKAWKAAGAKGQATTVLLCGDGLAPHTARASWREGDRALLVHLYGGIGGENAEPAAKTPLYWGHFSFGEATVIREPLAGELCFDIVYHQIYAHNSDGVTAGALHYSRYSGDRQYGWAGVRPIQDLLVKLDALTGDYLLGQRRVSALDAIIDHLEVMGARYRIADGRGSTKVGALNNCAQDGAQALYAAISAVGRTLGGRGGAAQLLRNTPEQEARLDQLLVVWEELRGVLVPWGSARADWEYGAAVLGGVDYNGVVGNVQRVAKSWRTMLPPVMARAIVELLLTRGASVWALRSFQVGGHDPSIEPYVPNV